VAAPAPIAPESAPAAPEAHHTNGNGHSNGNGTNGHSSYADLEVSYQYESSVATLNVRSTPSSRR